MKCVKCHEFVTGTFEFALDAEHSMCQACRNDLVESLPRTADGVPVAAGPCEVWLPKGASGPGMDDWELGTDKEVRKAKLYSGDDDLWCVLIEGDDEASWVECPIYFHREAVAKMKGQDDD